MKAASYQEHDDFTLKEKLTYSIVGLVVLGGSFLLGRSVVRGARATSEQKKTYEDGNAASFAQQLKMAFENDNYFGWGTDEVAIRDVIRKVPSKDYFKQVINSYQKLYARSLMADLKEELTSSEYNEMLAIIAGKPDKITGNYSTILTQQQYLSWAKRLKAAFDITYWFVPGTDEPAIKAVFMEIPTQADFGKVAAAYLKEYGNDLMSDLRSELEFWEFGSMMEIINKKPKV
ncbi:hypothetical protein [Flavisolibacter nicotianae]|uniref:hypothetical protein n=1 Tax=Flavisolibacter nicotianae TaxID=2364882 RepID=UPI000EB52B40|nr:hypothetical protein [Flavisolibacter nicotianae]